MAIKIDRAHNRSNTEYDELKERQEINDKQRIKLETLIVELPCVDKENATWLQNVNKNGGKCPGKNSCQYREDLAKGK
jgi:hypothetical protein